MFRKILSMFVLGSGAVAQAAAPTAQPDPAKIYPYVVPRTYFDSAPAKPKSVTWPLGHGLQVALVYGLDGLVRNVLTDELPAMGLSVEAAKKRALQNLEALAASGAIGQQRFNGPDQKPFVLFGGHWAAATCILLPGLWEMGAKNIGSQTLCVSVPHREALLMFAKGDKAYLEAMRKLIKENESDGRKPLTFELFELSKDGLKELKN